MNPEDLIVANVKYGKVDKDVFEDTEKCDNIEQDFKKTNIYHVPNQTENTKNIEFNFFRKMYSYSGAEKYDIMEKSCPRFFALTPETTLMDVKRMILDKLRGIFEEAPESDE